MNEMHSQLDDICGAECYNDEGFFEGICNRRLGHGGTFHQIKDELGTKIYPADGFYSPVIKGGGRK